MGRMLRVAGRLLTISGFFLIAAISLVWAQAPPAGTATFNQVLDGRLLTKSNSTVFPVTRGLLIGDATVCNIAVLFKNSSAPLTMTNVATGIPMPFSVKKLMSAGTTCTAVYALY